MDDDAAGCSKDCLDDTEHSFTAPKEEEPGPSGTLKPIQNWYQKFGDIFDTLTIDGDAKDWIMSNFHLWDSLDSLIQCEDLSPKKTKFVENALREVFADFLSQRQAFTRFLSSRNINIKQISLSPMHYHFSRGTVQLSNFVQSDDLSNHFSLEDCVKIRDFLSCFEIPDSAQSDAYTLSTILSEVEQILRKENLAPVVIEEVMKSIASFDDLKTGLEGCEELSRREIKLLCDKLHDVFVRMKLSKSDKDPKLRILVPFLESLSVPSDGIDWIINWLSSKEAGSIEFDSLDLFDDISKRQCKAVKDKLRELYKIDETQVEPKPACQLFLERVDCVLDNRTDIVGNARRWILENVCSFQSLDEFEQNDDLTGKQITFLKQSLKKDFEKFRTQESGSLEEPCEMSTPKQGSDSFEVSPPTSDDGEDVEDSQFRDAQDNLEEQKESPVSTIQLISFELDNQEGCAVEKFSLPEIGVQQLCQLVPENGHDDVPVFYNSHSHGIIIDFDRLNKLEMKCVGLFGPWHSVLKSLEPVLPGVELQVLIKDFEGRMVGLYLIGFKSLKQKFIVFFCEKDDFEVVRKDSRTVHFLRYMSQLTNDVIFCLGEEYQDRLATTDQEGSKSIRRARYALKKHEIQQESFQTVSLGVLHARPDVVEFSKFYSSAAGLGAFVEKRVEGVSEFKPEGGMGTVHDIKPILAGSLIEDLSAICEPFKLQYLRQFYPREYKEIDARIDKDLATMESLSDKAVEEKVLASVAKFFVKTEIENVYRILQKYFQIDKKDKLSSMWENTIMLNDYTICEVLHEYDIKGIRKALRQKTGDRQAVQKYLLWVAVKRLVTPVPTLFREKDFIDLTWEEVQKVAKDNFGSFLEPLKTQEIIGSEMARAAAQIDYAKVDCMLDYSIKVFIEFMGKLIKPFRRQPYFVAFCRLQQKVDKDEQKSRILTRQVVHRFDEICGQLQKSLEDNFEVSEERSRIIHIKKLKKAIEGKEFGFLRSTLKHVPAKNSIIFYQLTPVKEEQQRLALSNNNLDIRNVEFLLAGTLEVPDEVVLSASYVIDRTRILVILNDENGATCNVFSYSKMNQPFVKVSFGKTISESSFDSRSRILALHSCMDPGTIHLLRFNEDYCSFAKMKPMELSSTFGLEKENTFTFCIQPNSSFLWFFFEGRLRKMDLKKCKPILTVPIDTEDPNLVLRCTPDGGCLLATTNDGIAFPVMTDTGHVLDAREGVSTEVHLTTICNQSIAAQPDGSESLQISRVEVTGAQHETKLNKTELSNANELSCSESSKHEEHWLNYLYWMYTKFPCNDLLSPNSQRLNVWMLDLSENAQMKQKVSSELLTILQKLEQTHKPIKDLVVHSEAFLDAITELHSFQQRPQQLGKLLKKLITFVPIQIARCQSNLFHILDKGQPVSLETVNIAFDLIDKINLGFYESIFNAWNGDIKVISSMGKQSTGKSYTLNHLTGSSFNIAGTRCTDGCWMTVKEQDDCLYVILDFEGLGSFERTEQEDMLLSLFNSSISTITIFKTEKRLDRDIDKMFNKMNTGSDQLKGNAQVFRGKFVIVINDVAEQDVNDTPREFEEKISTIVTRSENNFIKKLYNGDFEIISFPAFESKAYYENVSNLLQIIKNELEPVFRSGPQFVGTLKLLMAKLAVNDFSPLDRQQIDERVRFLMAHLENAVDFGQTSDEQPKRKEFDLRSLDDPSVRIVATKETKIATRGTLVLNDFDVSFVHNRLENILIPYMKISNITPDNFVEWREGLLSYLEESIKFRFERVRIWLQNNLKKWTERDNPEYDDIIKAVLERLDVKELNFQQSFKFCDEKCSECFLKCTQIAAHKESHKCSTDHLCTAFCEFCDSEANNHCKLAFGHNGKHLCTEIDHICGSPCPYREINGCLAECQKLNGHSGNHECSEKRHPCKETCSLAGCEGRCVIKCDEQHSIHKCTREQCISKCSITACSNKCAALDHFHGSDLSKEFKKEQMIPDEFPFLMVGGEACFDSTEHFCGREHQCQEFCVENGFCQVWTEKQLKDETYVGIRDTFKYSLQFAEKGQKLTCRQKVKPFAKTHEGRHVCSNERHFCNAKCPTCENICDKHVNHEQNGDVLHHVRHGNMRNRSFVANEDDIQVGSHKYKVGEPAVAEMCHIFCNSMGRGHVHIVECDNLPGRCYYNAREDGRRHQTTNYYPNPEIPKDEMTHEAYWAMIGFQDPCQEIDVEEFQKCPASCPFETHIDDDEESLCVLGVLHNPVKKPSDANRATGFVTKDGHLFPCNHPGRFYHFILCLDDSGSMSGPPWWALVRAVQKFVRQRAEISANDMISIIIHHDTPRIVAEYISINDFSKHLLKYRGGGNDFSAALLFADYLIGRYLDRNSIPVLVFMSDGSCRNGEDEMRDIYSKYKKDHKLEIYTLGFGPRVRFAKLRELARIGQGEFLEAVNAMQLKSAFVDIAAKYPAAVGISV